MRLYAVLTTVLAAIVHASDYGSIYTLRRSSSQLPPATSPPLSLHDEQTFYAMRLGFRGPYLLHGVSDLDAMITLLNQAAPPDALYSDSASAVRRSMFVVEGTSGKDVFPTVSGRWDQVAHLAEEPSEDYGRSLIDELVLSASSHRGYTRDSPCRTKQKQQYSSIIEGVTIGPDTYGECSVKLVDTSSKSEHIPSALQKSDTKVFREGILDFFHYNSSAYSENIIRDILKEAAGEETREITVLVLPAGLPSGKEWSSRRGVTHLRREFSEESMEAHRPSPTPASMKKPIFEEDSDAVESVPVSATQPHCATSKKVCESRTNNCSGRGNCVLTRQKCWSCTCEATKESWGMAYWGGAACQKRDISVQFWLFAGFAIAATATITWGIGMLYSMGDQDLPSVLGAGVAPTLRK